VAWHPLGWEPAWFAEIDRFPKAVLVHRWPSVTDLGDFTKIGADRGPIDLLVGGTPCQSFSVAGLRQGLDDPRGNLMLEFGALARRVRARWLVWENVPGVLSSNQGRDFGSFLGMLGELGYGFAYRVLDAQYFGVAQRRRRVFVVGHAGGLWQRAAAVLLEPESLRGDPAPRRETRKGTAPTLSARTRGGGGPGTDFDLDGGLVAHSLRGVGFDASEDGTGRGTPIVAASLNAHPSRSDAETETLLPITFPWQLGPGMAMSHDIDCSGSLAKNQTPAVLAFDLQQITSPTHRNPCLPGAPAPTLSGNATATATATAVRRLTPRECERLQGFPDDYTAIPGAKDGPRYKALGNSMAVPVMRWIGERIQAVQSLWGG